MRTYYTWNDEKQQWQPTKQTSIFSETNLCANICRMRRMFVCVIYRVCVYRQHANTSIYPFARKKKTNSNQTGFEIWGFFQFNVLLNVVAGLLPIVPCDFGNDTRRSTQFIVTGGRKQMRRTRECMHALNESDFRVKRERKSGSPHLYLVEVL